MRTIFKRSSAVFWFAVLLALTVLSSAQIPAAAQTVAPPELEEARDAGNARQPNAGPASSRKPARRYFIEFRSRSAVSYGHSFVVHGRVGSKLTASRVAGLHPMGTSSLVYMLGHVLPVPAETGASDGDLEDEYLTARYRILLSEPQYKAMTSYIKDLQANSLVWNAATYNCNAFVAEIARFLSLQTPPTWMFPESFVNALRDMNTRQRVVAARN